MNKGIIIETLKKCVANEGRNLNIYDQVALLDSITYIEKRDKMWERLKEYVIESGHEDVFKMIEKLEDENR